MRIALLAAALAAPLAAQTHDTLTIAGRQVERLDRALVAVPGAGVGVHVAWRLLGTDPGGTSFTLYRNGKPIARIAANQPTSFHDRTGTPASRYALAVNGGAAGAPVGVWAQGYLYVSRDLKGLFANSETSKDVGTKYPCSRGYHARIQSN